MVTSIVLDATIVDDTVHGGHSPLVRQCIEFVEENNAGRRGAGLPEDTPDGRLCLSEILRQQLGGLDGHKVHLRLWEYQ